MDGEDLVSIIQSIIIYCLVNHVWSFFGLDGADGWIHGVDNNSDNNRIYTHSYAHISYHTSYDVLHVINGKVGPWNLDVPGLTGPRCAARGSILLFWSPVSPSVCTSEQGSSSSSSFLSFFVGE